MTTAECLTHEAAEALHGLLCNKAYTFPNGTTPYWQKELVLKVSGETDLQARLAVYNRLTSGLANKTQIDLQVFEFKPQKIQVEFIGKEKEKTFKGQDYAQTLKALGFNFRLCSLDDQIQVNGEPLSDVVESQINIAAHDVGLSKFKLMRDAYISEAARHSFNPIKDYLTSLKWDGTDWIETVSRLLVDEHDLMPVLLKRWCIGAVARVMETTQNRMLILDGPQGIGKSNFVAWLASPLQRHFLEGGINPDDKDHQIRLTNIWIWEVGEMGSTMRRADVEALKNFLTMREVKVRHPYGHFPILKPAITSFIGTVNNIGGVLNDATGSRRFMSTKLVSIDFDYVRVDVNQLWAQAKHLYDLREPWQPTPAELLEINRVNSIYEVENPVEDLIAKHFQIDSFRADWFTPTDRLIEIMHNNGWHGSPVSDAMVISTACKKLGLKKVYTTRDGQTRRGYLGLKENNQPSSPPT